MEIDEHRVAKQRESDCIISNRVCTRIIEKKYIYLQHNGHILIDFLFSGRLTSWARISEVVMPECAWSSSVVTPPTVVLDSLDIKWAELCLISLKTSPKAFCPVVTSCIGLPVGRGLYRAMWHFVFYFELSFTDLGLVNLRPNNCPKEMWALGGKSMHFLSPGVDTCWTPIVVAATVPETL